MAQWPCTDAACPTQCSKREYPTQEEVEAEEREFTRRWKAIGPARKAILATNLRSGAVDCPLCKVQGALHFSVSSYNGHVHAHCATKECLSWME